MDVQRLLMIDDDVKFTKLVVGYLQRFGYTIDTVHDGPQGLARVRQGNYDGIILDVMLPGMTGWDVLREIRRDSQTPVLMLTALGDEPDRISGLEIGADDYVPKTFSMRELLARLRSVLRRANSPAKPKASGQPMDAAITVGDLQIDPETHSATLAGVLLQLTSFEYDLLLALAQAHPRVKSREQLMLEISDRDLDAFDRSIDVRIASLRRKLGDDAREPRIIETVRSVGYRLLKPERKPEA
jgi:DNA-binding response OmpR family regulator